MKFTDMLKRSEIESIITDDKITEAKIDTKAKKPEEILRGAGFKIKLVTLTSFGTQFDFAKKYDNKVIEDILTDFTIKIKDKSVFIID